MGKDRDLPIYEQILRKKHFDDPDVCKYFLIGFCPHEFLINVKSNVGRCKRRYFINHLFKYIYNIFAFIVTVLLVLFLVCKYYNVYSKKRDKDNEPLFDDNNSNEVFYKNTKRKDSKGSKINKGSKSIKSEQELEQIYSHMVHPLDLM